ncbi:alpha/beta fold hydrolase [Paenibacillus aurantiacus]|uniref:Alpha/beta fold hydrolase n=1 Tax=Paenibacillus aurantiacus TaxID=1936118 RepID=A0ABV5KQ66_9BACL
MLQVPFLQVGDVSIHYRSEGRGVPILCVHPPCATSRLFTYVKSELWDRRRILTMDVRGHGRSESGEAKLSLPLLAEDMRRVLDQCDISSAYVCGYGPGAMAALAALIAYPTRFRGGILLSGSAAYHDIISRGKLKAALYASRLGAKRPIAWASAWREADNRTAFDGMLDDAGSADAKRWRDYASACLEANFERQLHAIQQPVLLLYGTKDQIGHHYANAMFRLLPNAELYGVKDADRQLLMKASRQVGVVMRQWVDKHENGSLTDTLQERDALMQELAANGIVGGQDGESWPSL